VSGPAWDRLLREGEHPSGIELAYMVMGSESAFPDVHYYLRTSFGDLKARLRDAADLIRWETRADAAFDPCRVAVLLVEQELSAAQVERAVFMAGRVGVGVDACGGDSMRHLDDLTARWAEQTGR
jgi:hypothetical protein